ncbi:hydroxyethylthiazole kinase [Clostridium rectalis]|uniref:hydroxyethylthiazole kinase n=1 Tax=Clostridium rectalis TaxID=2040295 RepID=UPI001FAB2E12|nr:hydroxyethylthiazole kinase [Clostridium rectalis]
MYKDISKALEKVKIKNPLIHNITNYVTINDCANVILAIGGSPVMADDENEVEEMVSIASSLVINIGTLNSSTVKSMLLAGKKANELGIPVILDPVGVGATSYRKRICETLIKEIKFAVIRGNISEIKNIAGIKTFTKGVDAVEESENLCKDSIKVKKQIGESLSKRLGTVIAISGKIDSVSNTNNTYFIKNGNENLCKVTGTGCMSTALIGAFCGGEDDYLKATISAVVSMGIAGEIAYEKAKKLGIGSFKVALMDAIYNINEEIYKERGGIFCE